MPIFATWRPNNENEAKAAIEALEAGTLKVTDVLLGAEIFGGGLFLYLYEEAVGWVLTPKQLPEERRSWKNDLFAYRKETIELLFQRIIQSAELKECKVKGEGLNAAVVLANVWVYRVLAGNECEKSKNGPLALASKGRRRVESAPSPMKKDPNQNSTDSAEIEALINRLERGQLRDEEGGHE